MRIASIARLGVGLWAAAWLTASAQAQGLRPGPSVRPVAHAGIGPGNAGPRAGSGDRGFVGRGFAPRLSGGLALAGLPAPGYDGYGYAGYGAPRTAVDASVRTYPSPSELVPPAWSYGTYGIPTVPGIATPPSGDPVVYVIAGGRRPPRAAGMRALSRDAAEVWTDVEPRPSAGGARVVTVRVPAR